MKYILISFFLSISLLMSGGAFAQNNSGTIKFERKTYWINIMSRLPWITQEDIDRDKMTWGKNQGKNGQKYLLTFTQSQSHYTDIEEVSESGYSWNREQYIIARNFEKNQSKEYLETLEKKYLIEGEIPKYKWKILNEIKEVAGYLCMKAETYDPIKKQVVHAWFTDAIPVQAGPEGYCGLPGMILELNINDGDVTIEAMEVNIDETEVILPDLPKTKRMKKIERDEFDKIIIQFIAQSFDSQRNPYWRIRY